MANDDERVAKNGEHPTTLSAQEARQGKELGEMRWVLHISLGLCVLAGIVLWVIYG